MRTPVAVLLLGSALAFGGCGGDGGSASAKPEQPAATPAARVPDSTAPVRAFADRVDTAIKASDCAALEALDAQSRVALACPAGTNRAPKAFARFQITGVAQYGTGGVIDYRSASAPTGASLIVNVGRQGQWGIDRNELTAARSVGTPISDRAGFDQVLKRFLTAIETGNCRAFFETAITASQRRRTACRGELPAYDDLGILLAANPSAKPFLLGGNSRVLFYGLLTAQPSEQFRTVTVLKTRAGATAPHLVSGVRRGPRPKPQPF